VIDASQPADEQWRLIDAELGAYGAGLDERPQIVVLNKIDLVPDPEFTIDDLRVIAVLRVSCATGAGIEEFRRALFELCPPGEPLSTADADGLVDFLVYRPRPQGRRFRILRTDRGFRVAGDAPWDDEELAVALKAAGVHEGDEVEIGDEVREWA